MNGDRNLSAAANDDEQLLHAGCRCVQSVPMRKTWGKIAGYSEGANQGACMAKQVAFNSVALISGGGNLGVPPPDHNGELFAADCPVAYDAIGVINCRF